MLAREPVAHPRYGTIALSQAMLLGPLPLAALILLQDWYVDVNAPSCGTGIGTQADPFCDIMDAVNAAAGGDTIHIEPGTYFENVVLDKDLDLIGTGGEQVTIIDGRASGSTVQVIASAVSLTGLAITNGNMLGSHGSSSFNGSGGGGLYADSSSSVALIESTVRDNTARTLCTQHGCRGGSGGGIACLGTLILLDTMVLQNHADGLGGGIYSGGFPCMASAASVTLVNTTVSANTATPLGSWAGGGVFCYRSQLQVTNSTIDLNTPSGVYFGLHDTFTMTDSSISGSQVGVFLNGYAFAPPIVMTNCTVSDISDVGVYVDGYATLTLLNSTVTTGQGTGIYVDGKYSAPSAHVTNSTVSGNQAGGIHVAAGNPAYYSAQAHLANAILSDNGPYSLLLTGTTSAAAASHSLIEGGWAGTGNLDADPLFVDPLNGDFRLLPGSPCIDAGDNLAVPLGIFTDLAGKRRFIDDPATPDTGRPGRLWPIVDMGAHEFGNDPPRKVRRR